jgi:hypothetical protein
LLISFAGDAVAGSCLKRDCAGSPVDQHPTLTIRNYSGFLIC